MTAPDPVALVQERARKIAGLEALGDDIGDAWRVVERDIGKTEDAIEAMIPDSLAGTVALVRYVRDFCFQEGWEFGKHTNKIAGNIIAGLERLAAGSR